MKIFKITGIVDNDVGNLVQPRVVRLAIGTMVEFVRRHPAKSSTIATLRTRNGDRHDLVGKTERLGKGLRCGNLDNGKLMRRSRDRTAIRREQQRTQAIQQSGVDDVIEFSNMLGTIECTARKFVAADGTVLIEDIATKGTSDIVDDRRAGNIQGLRELVKVDSQSTTLFKITGSGGLTRGYVTEKE